MTLETISATAPSCWAPYLVNGDSSGIDDADIAAADAFVEWMGCGAPVNCEDAGFMHSHDAYQFMPLGADCQRYYFLRGVQS